MMKEGQMRWVCLAKGSGDERGADEVGVPS